MFSYRLHLYGTGVVVWMKDENMTHHQSHRVLSTECVCRLLVEYQLNVCQVLILGRHLVDTWRALGEHLADTLGAQHLVNTHWALGGIGGVQPYLKCEYDSITFLSIRAIVQWMEILPGRQATNLKVEQ